MFELIGSEASYLRSLRVVINHFYASKPLKKTLTRLEHHTLFSNICGVTTASEKWEPPPPRLARHGWRVLPLLQPACGLLQVPHGSGAAAGTERAHLPDWRRGAGPLPAAPQPLRALRDQHDVPGGTRQPAAVGFYVLHFWFSTRALSKLLGRRYWC